MKKILAVILFAVSSLAFAEASFDQIQSLINSKQYAAAEAGLEQIIKNHPGSAKAYYSMAEAQAGLGNLDKAQKALNLAKGIDPTLKFVSEGSVRSLEQAITPQTAKITYEEPSHWFRNLVIIVLLGGVGYAGYTFYKRKEQEQAEVEAELERQAEEARQERVKKQKEREQAEEAAREALRKHPNYGNPRFDPTNPDVLLPKKTKAQLKAEADAVAKAEAEAEARRQRLRAEAAEDEARRARTYSSQPTTVVHQNSSNDMLTGVLIGNMLSGSHHSHDTTVIRERETVRESAPSRSSSWDNDSSSSSSSRSSSWDDSSSSSRSSSWDDSSSSSSSSWDSDSSSSSSSWDSGSSSSDSSW